MIEIIIALSSILVIIIAVVLIRTIRFKPNFEGKSIKEDVYYDKEKAVKSLQEMIKCKTVSNLNPELEDYNEFLKFEELLVKLFPNIHKFCSFKKVGRKSLLYKWEGESSKEPIVLMAHYDVVPVNIEGWEKDPFGGIIENDILWGRGTLDTKGTLNGVLNAVEALIQEGYKPKNDIYLAFGGDEEVNGSGAIEIIEYFKANDIKPGMVVDEGGAVVEKVFPGVKEKCAVVGIAEKGMLNVKMEVNTNGGHASSPKPNGAIAMLSKACINIERHPFKCRLSIPAKEMFNTLGRHSTFVYRMIFANLWLFKGVLNKICIKSGGELNALMRTTCALTQMEGSKAINVLPPKASVSCNLRLMCGETMDSAEAYLKKVVNNDKIKISILSGMNPSSISETDCKDWKILKKAIASTWDNTIVTPYLMIACSDSRHYSGFCDHVYRFSAMHLSTEERGYIHGNNERIPLETICKTVEFYIRLIKQC